MYVYTELDTCLSVCEMYVYIKAELDTCLSVCEMYVYT